jgi:hypothetical protein
MPWEETDGTNERLKFNAEEGGHGPEDAGCGHDALGVRGA